jgi:glycosyltransferase involved in cell wall biosynthesis
MRIAIIGTRGIPNHYGGFEECATHLAQRWVSMGHEVSVYNSANHPFQGSSWNGVQIFVMPDPEPHLGTFGQFIYDFNTIYHTRSQPYDIILQLGYTSSAIWQWLFRAKPRLVTNMDGIEWRRSKYPPLVRRFLRWSERKAARRAHQLIADHPAIQDHLDKRFGKGAVYIPYGAVERADYQNNVLEQFHVQAGNYHLLIARTEPENHLHLILEGITLSEVELPTLVLGFKANAYGRMLEKRFRSSRILFHPGVFDDQITSALRYYSRRYFHGHSVGGTNPSLLQAMVDQCLIYAHDNEFNRYVLGQNAHFFTTAGDIAQQLRNPLSPLDVALWKKNNLERIRREYNWDSIAEQYELVFEQLLI